MIYTFYSFKGGVGRSMALANLAELFYQRALKVLMIDFDLEAPGLERYFDIEEAVYSPAEALKRRGVIEMLISYKKIYSLYRLTKRKTIRDSRESRESEECFPFPVEPLSDFVTPIYPENRTGASLSLLSAGKRDAEALTDYAEQVRLFDWDDFYKNWDGERFFEWLRREAEAAYDVVLIDSRTGVSEMSGVCTHQLADVVVMFVAPNYQNLAGTELIARSLSNPDLIDKGRHGRPLSLLFVPSRVDPGDRDLFDQFADHFRALSNKFLDSRLVFRQDPFLDLRIPYQTYYSYMENVAVRTRERASAADLIDAYQNIAKALVQLAPSEESGTHDDLAKQFAQIYLHSITQEPEAFQEILNLSVKSIQEESAKGQQADVKKIEGKLAILARIAPDILEVTANTLLNPIHGLPTAIQKVAQKAKQQ